MTKSKSTCTFSCSHEQVFYIFSFQQAEVMEVQQSALYCRGNWKKQIDDLSEIIQFKIKALGYADMLSQQACKPNFF